MQKIIMNTFLIVVFLCETFVYCRNALHMFQQQRYELSRYTKWLFNKNNIHLSECLLFILAQVVLFVLKVLTDKKVFLFISLFVTICFSIYEIYKETKKNYIKDLVITARVKRQIVVFVLLLVLVIRLCLLSNFYITAIAVIYLPYLLIYLVSIITLPIENMIKKYYEKDARDKIDSFDNLIKIGITGSYGKTSTKNIVYDIISQNYFTLITPASYNTPMGITRTIREMLKPIHQIFVCEMGADKVGDISYLMDFVKPKYGVVTSIGPQHLATFKSQENIIKEKMQEVEMLPEDGVAFINVDNEFINSYQIKNNCKVVKVGIDNNLADYVATNIKYSSEGTSFTVNIDSKNYKFKTCLLGKHNITNILIGIAIAKELNISVKDIVKNVSLIKQIEHRLELKKINNFNFIDDAFNSNPLGSKMALDVLSLMSFKRVIVTPGMIDLGSKQEEYNFEFGKYMKDKTDYVVLVGPKQTKSIYEGLKNSGFNLENVIVVNDVREAFNYIYTNFSSKDTILLENDLPDAFNV